MSERPVARIERSEIRVLSDYWTGACPGFRWRLTRATCAYTLVGPDDLTNRALEIGIDLLDQLVRANGPVGPARVKILRWLGRNRLHQRLAVLDQPRDAIT